MKNKQWFTPVRFSHLTRHAAVGAIIRDQNDLLLYVKDTSSWPDKNLTKLFLVDRVKDHLKVSSDLVVPPEASIDGGANLRINGGSIPTVRFPNWAVCNHCNTLHLTPWKNNNSEISQKLKCPTCNSGALSQVTWCAVSSYGDLIDVPWHHICHRNSKHERQSHCRSNSQENYLKLELSVSGRWRVACSKCDAKEAIEMTDFSLGIHKQPGQRERKPFNAEKITYTVMEVNDPRVFSPVNERALVIPPESNFYKNSLPLRLEQNSSSIAKIKEATSAKRRQRAVRKTSRELKCTEEELLEALKKVENGESQPGYVRSDEATRDRIYEEFDALSVAQEFTSEADFITSHLTSEWSDYLDSLSKSGDIRPEVNVIDKLIAVNRLRVIEVYKGFQRAASDAEDFDPSPIVAPDFTGNLDWLPAIELFGEGMFFTLNNEIIEKWEHHPLIRQRASEIETRYQDSEIILPDEAIPTPRFILLHTLAHALVRELESIAGYPAASLQERIYSSAEKKIAGVLIYTAVPDIAGSLGGIIEQAKPRRFIKLLDSAFKQLEWCSMDPVCGDMEGQGPSWLNRAACHGCVLLPDTSCSYNNVFLDRVFIKGKPDEGIPSLKEFVKK